MAGRLRLAYNPAIPAQLLARMEKDGKALGLALGTLEDLGQSEALCRAFVAAARRGDLGRMRALAGLASEVGASRPRPLALA